jgi:hypothetical protein
MSSDPVVAEIRRIREELAAHFNYDLDAILDDARRRDAAESRKVIRLPPRRPVEVGANLDAPTGTALSRASCTRSPSS